jgi:predicted ATP-grasp superfamily ATP-dependent carboligase
MGADDDGHSRCHVGILKGDTSLKEYLRSLRNCNAEAVFSASDPAPGLGRSRAHSVFGNQERLLKPSSDAVALPRH